jgi:protein-L-isoaspartate(D-aspartate) O-methyltransferase
VFNIAKKLSKDLTVLEIGSGQGDVTSIFCYLNFKLITAYEENVTFASIANAKLNTLFGKKDIVKQAHFPHGEQKCDILVLVNCVYGEDCTCKTDYMNLIKSYYYITGSPRYFILEVIDSSYTQEDNNFPSYVRLSYEDICGMFPTHQIRNWETYHYPVNKRTKQLYLLTQL